VEKEKINEMLSWRVDGLIIAPAQRNMDAGPFWDLWRQQVPFILLDRTFPDTPFASVTTDDESGAKAAVEFLIQRGMTRIACMGGPMILSTNRLRRSGYQEALMRHGIMPRGDYVFEVDTGRESCRGAMERLLALDPRPQAVFFFSDELASEAMRICLDHNLRVPADLALVGYADYSYSSLLRVPLTTVRQPCDVIGRALAEALLARLADETTPSKQYVIPVELIVRESA
jgi:DNA-binding LacI/PurR family transcriptional regulator